ncbi:amidase [Parendozoicomonas haliclonae]|uniref:6-aminohexanoate-cyclic-dimer hydrolase n=1 Tax=Parendozoicomonas haliclonae TaxID=1960125 RepID=A0A1X7AFR7_9GAMM|nr:amidase [Parendozoicomonas haliclonae]SMA36991.1 6-aminohexanoate-cyclic-dimer hydrolase [Parendozoicomonas haliclonae]
MGLYQYDATGLAELIRSKQISADEAFDYVVSQIEALNPAINAVIRTRYEAARKELTQVDADAPFAGVPFLTKDLLASIEGEILSFGSKALANNRATADASLVKRFRKAGLVILGQTNTPELGLMGITEPKAYGPSRNPWDLNRTPGGSSGGTAAAVAAGIVPMASGGDGGGSIRIPSSCCGLFGLKPSRGVQPIGPFIGEAWAGAVSEHVLTRSVRDSAAMLDITNGMDCGAAYPVKHQEGFLAASQKDPKPLRIGFSTKSPTGSFVDEECKQAVANTVQLLTELGHQVEEIELPLDGEQLASSFFKVLMGQTAKDVASIAELAGTSVSRLDIELPTRSLYKIGSKLSARDYLLAHSYWNELSRNMGELHKTYDVIVTPTLATPPQPVGALYPSAAELMSMRLLAIPGMSWLSLKLGMVETMARDMLDKVPFTQIANMTGQPSMSVPLHWSRDGLPVGVQFTGAIGEDAVLFSLAGQLERSAPWAERWPELRAKHQAG